MSLLSNIFSHSMKYGIQISMIPTCLAAKRRTVNLYILTNVECEVLENKINLRKQELHT